MIGQSVVRTEGSVSLALTWTVAYVLADLLAVDGVDASSIPYVADWSKSDPTVLARTATNVQHAVNTIAAGRPMPRRRL